MKHRKTILISSNTSWFIYNFHYRLIEYLIENGYAVAVIAPGDDTTPKIEALGARCYDIGINNMGTNPREEFKLIFDYRKRYKAIAPDIILHYTIKPNIYGSLAAGTLGIPTIATITGLGTVFLRKRFSSGIARTLYKIALRFPKKVFFLNRHDRQLFVDTKLIKSDTAERITGSGIDTEKFKPIKREKSPKDPLRFLLIARLIKDKGIIEFVEAARKILDHNLRSRKKGAREVEFSILGGYYPGNPSAITKEEISAWEEEGTITYLGTSDRVQNVLSTVDCVVLPSYREGISQVLLEAASMEKPIITSNVPGCKEVVDDGINGYLCDAKSVDSLTQQIQKMIALSDELREEMGRRGREKVILEFDEKIVNKKYFDTIESILANVEK